jgi:hypothetical protein
MAPRTTEQRKADALAHLEATHADLWVASASPDGTAHLVPLSFAWDGEHVVIATTPDAATTRNLAGGRRARLGLGGTRDVVVVDVVAVDSQAPADAPALAERYAAQADWDPRDSDGDWLLTRLRPRRIQVWREEDEIAGRTVMRAGEWVV